MSVYPGISHGSGIEFESTAEPFCIPWQNFINFSGFPNSIVCTISDLSSLYFGDTLYPNFSNSLLANTAVFRLLATTLGAKYIPCKKLLFAPKVGPTSFPCPGDVSLSAQSSTYFSFPATYAPLGAIPPPKFFIREPTITSAPTSNGVFLSTNSQ